MRTIRSTLCSTVLLCLIACTTLRPKPPEVQLVGLELTNLSLTHANFLASLKLYNPNSVDLKIGDLAFTLYLNEMRMARGHSAKPFSVPAGGFSDSTMYLSSSYFDLLQLSTSLQGQKKIAFRISGTIRVGGGGLFARQLSIEREGTLPLSGQLGQVLKKPLAPDENTGIPQSNSREK